MSTWRAERTPMSMLDLNGPVMSLREVGKALGMHYKMVEYIEQRALAKLRARLTGQTFATRTYRCTRCGGLGHGRRTCER